MAPLAARNGQRIEDLYNRITGEEDARVCKDIPEAACNDQPHNFFAQSTWPAGRIVPRTSQCRTH